MLPQLLTALWLWQDKVVGSDRFAAQAWGQMMRPGLPPFGPGMLNGRMDGMAGLSGLSRASAGGPIGPPMATGQGLNRMSVGLYQTESAAGAVPRPRQAPGLGSSPWCPGSPEQLRRLRSSTQARASTASC